MSDPPRLLEQGGTSPTALEMLRSLEPAQAAPPAVHAALAKDLSGLAAGSALKAATATVWLKPLVVAALAVGTGGALLALRSAPPDAAPQQQRAPAKPTAPAAPAAAALTPTPEPAAEPAAVTSPEHTKS